jgi:beta-barrel assembly-enhancing protease
VRAPVRWAWSAASRWLCACTLSALTHIPVALSQTEASTQLAVDIAPQPLSRALENLAHQSGLEVVYLSDVIQDQTTQGAPAGTAARDALAQLLDGTGLTFRYLNARMVRILTGEAPLETVVVIGTRLMPARPAVAAPTDAERLRLTAFDEEIEQRIARGQLLYGRAELDSYLQRIAARLLSADGSEAGCVGVRVIKGADASAFALSNGSIYVTTALLESLGSEAEVAAVLGHEITHYANDHVLRGLREEDRRTLVARSASMLAWLAVGVAEKHAGLASPHTTAQVPDQVLRMWARASMTGYSENLEREADDRSVRRLIAAGYDASGAVTALRHLSEQVPPGRFVNPPPLYASHPQLARRLSSYRDLLAGRLATAVAAGGELRRSEYAAQIAGLHLDQVAILLQAGDFDRADTTLDAVIGADSARAEFLRGEIARRRDPGAPAGSARALAAYERAVRLPDPPAEAFREQGYLYWRGGDFAAARAAFASYLARAPQAADAPMVRSYLEQPPSGSSSTKAGAAP